MKTIKITDITYEALKKIKRDTLEELEFKPSFDDIIKGLILLVITELLGKEFKAQMELIKYDKK